MKFGTFAAIAVLVLGSLAADNVAPSKAELDAMYENAMRAYNANNFPEALKQLDAIDTRQPDLAGSQNLRGVIMMHQGIYDKAEAALNEALRIDPKFRNARFNLAEIAFLQKHWAQARERFQGLLSGDASELQGEAAQLLQYKILLTYLFENKESMVDSLLAKLELSPDTPAVHYANAAISLQQKKPQEAKEWIAQAEKNFSPQLNGLFAESLYEVGLLQRQAGQTRAALELDSASGRAAKSKAVARSGVEQARQAYERRDFATALKFVDEANAADPNQAATLNLRGEILLEQKQFDQAETEFKKALKADSKFRQAQFNLALVPLKKKDYAGARDRFEALLSKIAGGDKSKAVQLIKFNIYMTYLLEGNESRAQKLMEQFQFTSDTPALYYAQAAWEFKHNNLTKATDWITSAKKIYSSALNGTFAHSFYDLGWMQSPALAMSPALTVEAATAFAEAQTELPALAAEPPVVAEAKATPAPAAEAATALAQAQTESSPAIEPSPIPGIVSSKRNVAEAKTKPAIAGLEATAPKAEAPFVSTAITESPGVEMPVAPADAPARSASVREEAPELAKTEPLQEQPAQLPALAAEPPVVAEVKATPAPARVGEVSRKVETGNLFAAILVLAGIGLIGWVIAFEIRRRWIHFRTFRRAAPSTGPQLAGMEYAAAAPAQREMKVMPRLTGGPRQISLRLEASEPLSRRAVVSLGKPGRIFAGEAAAGPLVEGNGKHELELEPAVETSESVGPDAEHGVMPAVAKPIAQPESFSPLPISEPELPAVEPVFAQAESVVEPIFERELEPIGQGQPIPQLTPVEGPSILEVTEPELAVVEAFRQPTTPVTMPEPVQIPTAPSQPIIEPVFESRISEPMRGGAPATGAMQTSVQLTFAFEIASMQLTPTFKVGALQLRPASKVVTLRLAGLAPQPAMNLQVSFEIARIQPAGGTLGSVRLTPSQQERPTVVGSPSFTVGGLHLDSDFARAPLQLTPSQQGQAAVHVVAPFQIATVEFSASFEISSIVLNSSSKQVMVQMPTAAGAPVEGAPVLEISNLQLTDSGEIAMMQLNLPG